MTWTTTAIHARFKVALLLSMVLILPVYSLPGLSPQPALGAEPEDIVAHVVGISVMGRVEVFREVHDSSGRSLGRKWWLPPAKGEGLKIPLKIMDQVKTDREARARITFTDERDVPPPPNGPTTINIGGNTVIAISEFKYLFDNPRPARGVINLIQGTIRNFIRGFGRNNSDFSVRAGVSVCRLRDAEAQLEYDPGSGRLLVQAHKGKVVVTTPYGSRILCAPTSGITCPKGSSTSGMFIDGKLPGGPS